MLPYENLFVVPRELAELRKLVRQGEGAQLEFKRKATYPEKLVREMIAFANTGGGVLLIGVADDATIPGVKFPEEELVVLRKAVSQYCRPAIPFVETIIPISGKKFVVKIEIPASDRLPAYYVSGNGGKECVVRVRDMSVKASREMTEIVRRARKQKNIRFTFGDAEKKLMQYLDETGSITLNKFRSVAGLNRFMAGKKLVLLVLANVLKIIPGEKEDLYTLK